MIGGVASRSALQAAHDFATRLRERFGSRVLWVRLYGSQARGESTERSDVDVLAVVRALTWNEKVEAIDFAFDVGLASGLHVSPVVMADDDFDQLVRRESSFASNVLRDGISA